jgi:hypothetical protein
MLGKEQNGVGKVWSGSDIYFAMKILLEKRRVFNMEIHIAFVNLTKAFGKVNITKLFEILTNDNIPQQIMQNIYNLYKTNMIPKVCDDGTSIQVLCFWTLSVVLSLTKNRPVYI